MKPVFQEVFDEGRGDCYRCCIASLLDLPRQVVPNFRSQETDTGVHMATLAREWLRKHFNLSLVEIYMHQLPECSDDFRLVGGTCGTLLIATYDSPNIPNAQHAVVGEIDEHGLNIRIVHDPNPNGKPITTYPRFISFLVPLHPRSKEWLNDTK